MAKNRDIKEFHGILFSIEQEGGQMAWDSAKFLRTATSALGIMAIGQMLLEQYLALLSPDAEDFATAKFTEAKLRSTPEQPTRFRSALSRDIEAGGEGEDHGEKEQGKEPSGEKEEDKVASGEKEEGQADPKL